MGSLESGIPPIKRERQQHSLLQRNRSRSFLFKRFSYIQWICSTCVFFFFVVLFQMFLPGLVIDKSDKPPWRSSEKELLPPDMLVFKERGVLSFGNDVRLEPNKLLMSFQRDDTLTSSNGFNTTAQRFGFRKPKLALVFADLLADPEQLLMVTVSNALIEIGYAIEVYSLEDGPVHGIWQQMGISVTILETNRASSCVIDWLSYDGVIVNSLEARSMFTCFMQEPFKSIPLVWAINDETLAVRSRQYSSTGHTELLTDWKKIFSRASVVVFHNYLFPILYSEFDAGNFYVIPGSPKEAWKTKNMDFPPKDDIVISIVGSQFLYKGQWLEHALFLEALRPLFSNYNSESYKSHLKIIVLGGESASNYSVAIETISQNLTYPKDAVKHVSVAGNVDKILESSDLVIYGSFLEEQSFPEILMKAMALGKPVVAPDLLNIKKHVDDRVSGYLFPKENLKVLSQIVLEVITGDKISPLAQNIRLMGKTAVKNMMAVESIEGYATLLENILKFSSDVASPKDVHTLPSKLREGWSWHLFEALMDASPNNRTARSYEFIANVEGQWNQTPGDSTKSRVVNDDSFVYEIWEGERYLQIINSKKRQEDEELKARALQYQGTWEEVYKSAKRADRSKNDLHERDEGELERTGQPLCIYEPYFGEGTWSFLHEYPLYRGVGMSVKGRRPGMDDIDASSRLPLFNQPYYRDALGDFGAFFAISNKIDRLHRNAWIGFQSWRATARKESLSEIAENALLNAIKTRKHGDALYFWVRMDKDPRNPLKKPFWSFCDAINAGNCRFAYNETLKKMYSVKNLDSLPPMPEDGDTWSVMQSWVLPTKSFVEFVMFSRMFVDSLDAQMYEEHHRTNRCYLSLTEDKHCYSRVLELLVNVWAYHSARRIVYIDPITGLMEEQHKQMNRRGKMWVDWFGYTTLKTMDEDLAEEADSNDRRVGHWLWPWTGEVVWRGSLEKERQRKNVEKEEQKKRSKDKLDRMRRKSHRQKAIGKYIKPPPENANEMAEESHVLEINLISAQGLKEPTGKLRRLQTYASVWVDSSTKLRTRIDRIGAENPIWNDKFVFQVSSEFLSSETSGVSIEIYAVGYLRDHLIGTVRFLVSNFLPTAAEKVPSLVALQIRRPSGKFRGVLNIAAMVIDASELPAGFFKSVREKEAESRRSRRMMKKSRSAVVLSENGLADDGGSSKENSLSGSVNFSDDGTDSTASTPMPSPLRDWNAVRNMAGKNHVRWSSDGGGMMCCFLMKSEFMARFTRQISAMEVRATQKNRVRYSSKNIKHLPSCTITEFDLKDYSPLGFRLIQELEDIDHDDYMHSICNDKTLNKLSSGKIGNVFLVSNDDRFLIKILRKSEIKVILETLPGYYRHIHNHRSSLFSRIYGAHVVKPVGGVKTYFAVMSNMLHSKVFMNKLYDLKGSPKGRTNKKIELRNNTVFKDIDLDFCFYVDPLARQRIIKQTKLDCDLLEEQGIMDYSLLVGLQVKESSTQGSVNGVNPVYGSFTPPCSLKSDSTNSLKTALNSPDSSFTTFYSCPPSRESVESENSMTSNSTGSENNLINRQSKLTTLSDLFVNSSCSSTNFGMKIPARARRVKRAAGEEEEWYDVVLYLGIVDTFQDYGMKKRIEHCYKTIQHNSNSISTVHPKIYSSRFQEFVSNIFLPRDDGDLSL
ncbi:hypothetical protein IGI04_032891 [Brassica rapa subsp. trilocularis]|uniref:1-phosphatidylinositol-4-phosphate 5-kinase n=1 Tax=Brassica rapa subsp. trilocularis TaxID=1813537 RepID=A0ABQ7L492_BRACM|nr:hypothetical protein IGI04_032891 [Brassica rapa subsp. trilocularis]